jgi:hypothetical protein
LTPATRLHADFCRRQAIPDTPPGGALTSLGRNGGLAGGGRFSEDCPAINLKDDAPGCDDGGTMAITLTIRDETTAGGITHELSVKMLTEGATACDQSF